jgi:hypothetical protein
MPLLLQLVQRRCRGAVDAEVVDGDVAQHLKEPAREFALGVEGVQTLVDAKKTFLSEIFRKRSIVDEPVGEVDGRSGVPRDELAVRRLGTGTRGSGQLSVASLHGHALYGASTVPSFKSRILGFGFWDFYGFNNSLVGGATRQAALSVVSSGIGRPSR